MLFPAEGLFLFLFLFRKWSFPFTLPMRNRLSPSDTTQTTNPLVLV